MLKAPKTKPLPGTVLFHKPLHTKTTTMLTPEPL